MLKRAKLRVQKSPTKAKRIHLSGADLFSTGELILNMFTALGLDDLGRLL